MRWRRWLLLALLLMSMPVGMMACGRRTEGETPDAGSADATWTPTAVVSPTPLQTPTALAPALPATAIPDPTASPTAAATPTATPIPITPEPASAQRIDDAGPASIPTVAPLPPGTGLPPVRIRIPAVGLDAPVQPMSWQVVGDRTEWQVPENAAGHHIDSAFPGEAGNVVISGHHNIAGSVFADISPIGEPGVPLGLNDEIVLTDEAGREFVYRISGWHRIPEANASVTERKTNARALQPTDFPQLTLITCWPASSNTHRVVITATLTDIHTP